MHRDRYTGTNPVIFLHLNHHEDGGGMVLRIPSILPHHYTASYPRRPWLCAISSFKCVKVFDFVIKAQRLLHSVYSKHRTCPSFSTTE